ncbi:acyltransferase family protein [Prosthecobacter sp. SYSU 5D2]|uniref:acyltransferase family protein n=1 Tax=Prosthecobacter sp. SYSU 5D2 TaxID=3134134 RepID=UPI0031FEFF5D
MQTSHNFTLDLGRCFFAFCVVFVHLGPADASSDAVGRAFNMLSVPFFITLALYFFIHRLRTFTHKGKHVRSSLKGLRFDRICVPYAAWTLIYISMRFIKHGLQDQPFIPDWLHLLFFGGAGVHLYFLPFLMLCQTWVLGFFLIFQPCLKWRAAGLIFLISAAGFGLLGMSRAYLMFESALHDSLLYAGLAAVVHWRMGRGQVRWPESLCYYLTVIVLAAGPAFEILPPWMEGGQKALAGFGVTMLLLSLPSIRRLPASVVAVVTSTYGIYLSHHALIETVEVAASRLGLSLVPYSLASRTFIALLTCLVCALTVIFIRKNKPLRYLLLGENGELRDKPAVLANGGP